MISEILKRGPVQSREKNVLARLFSRAFRLQGKLIIPYVMLTLLMAIIGIYVTTRLVTAKFRERFVNQIYESARIASDSVVRQENENLGHLRAIVFTEGMNAAIAARDAGTIEALTTPLAITYGIDSVTVLDRSGVEILTLGLNPEAGNYTRSSGTDFSQLEFVQRILAGAADDQGDKFVGMINSRGGPALFTGSPVYDASQRNVIGAVMVGVPLSRLLGQIQSQGLTLADVVLLNNDRKILITSLAEPEGGFGTIEAYSQTLTDDQMAEVHPLRLYGREYQVTFAELTAREQRFGWLAVLLPGDYVVAAGAISRNTVGAIFTGGTVAMILVGIYLSQSIARPILKLHSLTQAVAAGNLNQESGLIRSDEIGELAGAFDLMTLRLRERTAEATRLYAEAIQRNKELADTNARLRTTQQQLIQSEKLAAIGQLTAGIVHDVKNPLTVIKGVAELLLSEDDLTEEMRTEISLMRESAVKANNIVTDLLKFARQSRPDMEVHDLRETVEAALRLTAFPIRKAHVQLAKDLPADPIYMAYDDQQIEQVLVNIISNALQAMPKGGGMHVHVGVSNGSTPNAIAAIAIQDTGIGIAPENLNRIFDPFFTTKSEGEGTGLGLSVGYGIISNHNGRIEVESELGKGSTFTILLPVRQPEPVEVIA